MARSRIDVHAHHLGGSVDSLFASGFTPPGVWWPFAGTQTPAPSPD
ncbi:hypothetical protein OHB07_35330 [Streptomyces sp. NBC_00111]|nr:hypothetical protein [Streptomyces sp. NBC_01460]